MAYLLIYIVGFIIAIGVRGGVRDEMEGIGDMAFIAFWPIVLAMYIIYIPVRLLVKLGKFISRSNT